MSQQSGPQRSHNPQRMRKLKGQARIDVTRRRGDHLDPLCTGAFGHAAQHRIHESGGTLGHHRAGQGDTGVDCRVVRNPHAKDLVGTHPQDVQHRHVDRVEVPPGCEGDDRVVETLKPNRAVADLGGKRRVTTREARLAQLVRKFEIGVGAVRDSPHREVCGIPCGIAVSRAVGGPSD